MKKLVALMLSLIMVLSLAACGGSEGNEGSGDSDKIKAACVLGVGGLGDQGYNDLIYAGMERAKTELGIDFDYAEPKQVTDFEQILRDMSDSISCPSPTSSYLPLPENTPYYPWHILTAPHFCPSVPLRRSPAVRLFYAHCD